jgi:hypothetical protein
MNDTILIAIITALAGLTGCVITATVYLYINKNKIAEARHKAALLQAYKDIAAFYRLEEMYTSALCTEYKSPESIKRAYRRMLRAQGLSSPSHSANITFAEKKIEKLNQG